MTIASFAGFGFGSALALADRLGLLNALAFANVPGLANDIPLTGGFSLACGLALTAMFGFFYILAMVNLPGLAGTLIFADKPGLGVITTAIIIRTHNRRCHIAATKLIGRHAC